MVSATWRREGSERLHEEGILKMGIEGRRSEGAHIENVSTMCQCVDRLTRKTGQISMSTYLCQDVAASIMRLFLSMMFILDNVY